MKISTIENLIETIKDVRAKLDDAFSPDTAAPGTNGLALSSGQCAAVSIVLNKTIGGQFVSAHYNGISHWFNRVVVDGKSYDVDLTGDQFDRNSIQVGPVETLYANTNKRNFSEIDEDTLIRAKQLAMKAGMISV